MASSTPNATLNSDFKILDPVVVAAVNHVAAVIEISAFDKVEKCAFLGDRISARPSK
jgi:hypothetical protein